MSSLYESILGGNYGSVKKLLMSNEFDVNDMIPGKGITVLHLAVGIEPEESAIQLTELILTCGGDPNKTSEDKLTALHVASAWGRMEIVKILLEHGADSSLIDEDFKTPIDYAEENGHFEIAQHITNYGRPQTDQSPVKYTFELDKVLINNDDLQVEYTSKTDNDDENRFNAFVIDKSDLLNKKLPIVYDYSQESVSELRELLSKDSDSFNSCGDSESFESCISSTDKNCLTSPLRDKTVASIESGVNTIEYTNNDDNRLYDVYLKEENHTSSPVFNVTIPNSQQRYSHMNYNFKSSCSPKSKPKINDKLSRISTKKLTFEDDDILNERLNDEESLADLTEEYQYEDKDAGIVLKEKRLRSMVKPHDLDAQSICSSASSVLPPDYDTDTLKRELKDHGDCPGPITRTTKKVYLKRLRRIKKNHINLPKASRSNQKVYSIELEKTFRNSSWFDDLSTYAALERVLVEQFDSPDPKKRWREGLIKSSFTYLLLDPRISKNLPCRYDQLGKPEIWRQFIDSIFYVGKGKRSRPYSHLYQAVSLFNLGITHSEDKKVKFILEIWNDGTGVVCLHIFQNVIPVEAYTREAAMIETLGLKNLKNLKPGNYYGNAATWPLKQKKLLGVYLLYRAMLIFLSEGERRLRPADICK